MKRTVIVWLAAALCLWAGGKADRLFQEGRKAEREGDVVRAYLLYSLAAAEQPKNPTYWGRAQALRTQAALKAGVQPAVAQSAQSSLPARESAPAGDDGAPAPITEADLHELRRLQPPPELVFPPGTRTLELEGDARSLFEQAARSCSLDVVFDGDFQPGPRRRLRILDADCRQALDQLQVATGSFVVPLSERLFLVAQDTPQKRAELEPVMAVTIPIPHPVSPQEAQELVRAVQQAMEIVKVGFDSQRRLILLRDRVSKVLPAQALLAQLLTHKAQVVVELELIEVDRSALLTYGLRWPTDFPFFNFSRIWNAIPYTPVSAARGFLLGGGRTLFGIGVGDAELLANFTELSGRTLLQAQLRSLAGQPASFHVGDQYPVMTAGYFGYTYGMQAYTPPPSFQFADLGLVLKYVPYVHGPDEVTLEIEGEFKLLAGESVNGIPVLSNRRVASKVRLKAGQWAIVAGLLNSSEARTLRGLAGLARLPLLGPLFRQQSVTRDSSEVLILLKPEVVGLPPSHSVTPEMWVGSEGRLRLPL